MQISNCRSFYILPAVDARACPARIFSNLRCGKPFISSITVDHCLCHMRLLQQVFTLQDPVGNCKPGQNGPLGPSTRSQPPYAGLQLQQPGPLTAGLVWILTRVDPAPLRPSCKRSKGVGTW